MHAKRFEWAAYPILRKEDQHYKTFNQSNMKLKIYNPENAGQSGKSSKPSIAFSKNGLISFNKAAVAELNLKPGDQVELAEDEENEGDWYFKIVMGGGFVLKEYKQDGRLNFNSAKLVLCITEPLGVEKALIPISLTPTEEGWYPLLTAAIKK